MNKLAALVIVAFCFAGCSTPPQKGILTLKNGSGEKVSVEYDIAEVQYDLFLTQVKTKSELQAIAEKTSSEAMLSCKFRPTYEPKSINFIISNDTITVFHTFFAKNAFGVPSSEWVISTFKGTTFIKTL